MVVDRRDQRRKSDGVQGVESGERAPQVLVEQALVAEHHDDLAIAQSRHTPHDRVATPGEFGVGGEVGVHLHRGLAHRRPRVLVRV